MQCNVLGEEEKIDVLYGSAEPAVARRVRQHVSGCATCREEMTALEGTRERLRHWTLPEASRPTVRPAAPPLGPAPGGGRPPGARRRLRSSRLGDPLRGRPALVPHRDRAPTPSLRQLLAEQDARHQREIAALPGVPRRAVVHAPRYLSRSDVQSWIRESEARQSQRFLARFEEFKERSDSQRRLDMARVSAGLSYLDGKNGQHVARTSELMNYMLQASYKR